MDSIPKRFGVQRFEICDSRDHFTLFSRVSPEEPDSAQNSSRQVATRVESTEVQAGIRSRKRVWSAPPSSTVLARETILYKKEHTLEKRKVPSATACTHARTKQANNRETFSHFLLALAFIYYPFALNLYAWNEIFLKLFCDGSPQKKPNWTMETTPRTTTALIRIIQFEISVDRQCREGWSFRNILSCILNEANKMETSSCSRFLGKNIFYIFSPNGKKVTIFLMTDDKNKIQIYYKLWLRVSVWTKYFNNLFEYLLAYERIRKDCTGRRNTSVRTQLYARGRHLQRAETSRRFQELSIEAFVKKSAI